jgi:hypothetical protein
LTTSGQCTRRPWPLGWLTWLVEQRGSHTHEPDSNSGAIGRAKRLRQFRNDCRPKARFLSGFFSKKSHLARPQLGLDEFEIALDQRSCSPPRDMGMKGECSADHSANPAHNWLGEDNGPIEQGAPIVPSKKRRQHKRPPPLPLFSPILQK